MKPNVFVVSVVKDEADIIEPWCEHYANLGIDKILVFNGSCDETNDILEEKRRKFSGLLQIWRDHDVAHRQDLKMTRLCGIAHEMGADWILPVDADEFWIPTRGDIKGFVAQNQTDIRQVQQIVYFPSCHDDLAEDNPVLRIRGHLPASMKDAKVCFRWKHGAAVNMGNHSLATPGVTYNYGYPTDDLVIHHFPYRSEDHFVAKIRRGLLGLAAAPELTPEICVHWRNDGDILATEGENGLRARYRREIYHDESRVNELVFDPFHFSAAFPSVNSQV